MRFKLDENLPVEFASLFRRSGRDAVTVLDQGLGGARDPELASVCSEEGRVLVTFDTDFSDIRTYPPKASSGIIVLRLSMATENCTLVATENCTLCPRERWRCR